ncbi:hypothetical protein EDF58_102600 [Novosphingobium sp. PhB57]|jgi:hypothetical protein|nr:MULTISPECIES: hypothetical protein [unclassified Novosphingobium]TCU59911.1 hypothetical protein EDF58_102600 [Novosphingobium sp. PhB57]TDW62712.1 hypothetical protein EDF57_107109 [Novosphingobium sp. PhB55]
MNYHKADAFDRVQSVPHRFSLPTVGFRRDVEPGALSRQDLRRLVAAMVD